MGADSAVGCGSCGGARAVSFAWALRHGWPACCGETMTLARTAADIERAVGEAIRVKFTTAVNKAGSVNMPSGAACR